MDVSHRYQLSKLGIWENSDKTITWSATFFPKGEGLVTVDDHFGITVDDGTGKIIVHGGS